MRFHRLTELECITIISNISYKPGWTFGTKFEKGKFLFSLKVEGICSTNKTPFGATKFETPDYESMDEMDLIKWVYEKVRWFERHEMDEWFEYKGVKIYDPHADDETNYRHIEEFKMLKDYGI